VNQDTERIIVNLALPCRSFAPIRVI